MRPSGRAHDAFFPLSLETGFARHAKGSCLIRMGGCRGAVCRQRGGAELPTRSCKETRAQGWVHDGGIRDAAAGHPHARRPRGGARQAVRPHAGNPAADRAVAARDLVNRAVMGEMTITQLDCDVLNADGEHAALRGDHRGLGGAESGVPSPAEDECAEGRSADRSGGRRLVRVDRRGGGAGPRLC